MAIVNTLEETLNGGYGGLYGEVVTEDTYRIKKLDFIPSLIFDIGANIGVFTRYCRQLFPQAFIVAVEPDNENVQHFQMFTFRDSQLVLLHKALGKGNIWRSKSAANGAGESYVSSGLGFPDELMQKSETVEKWNIPTITLPELVDEYMKYAGKGGKSVCKIDIEGGENAIFEDPKSIEALKTFDYICAEIHFYSIVGGLINEAVRAKTISALQELQETHDCELDHIYFYARKKEKL